MLLKTLIIWCAFAAYSNGFTTYYNPNAVTSQLVITDWNITANIQNRFAVTDIKCKMVNFQFSAKNTEFFVVIPNNAFIRSFSMEIAGETYTAEIKEREEALKIYKIAEQGGEAAGHIAIKARNSDTFKINANVPPGETAIFYLTYEELMIRKNGTYELIVNVHPKQVVENFNILVNIDESEQISYLKAQSIRSTTTNNLIDIATTVNNTSDKSATIKFAPNVDEQKAIARMLGNNANENDGILGQFIVQYDLSRDKNIGGDILTKGGYFVHFFAPDHLKVLNKHIIFVLDTSGSMKGQKISELKVAMGTILDDLKPNDYFNIVQFAGNIKVWNMNAVNLSTVLYYKNSPFNLIEYSFPPTFPGVKRFINAAKNAVQNMLPGGKTNIHDALLVSLHLIERRRAQTNDRTTQPIIVFLTDGRPYGARKDPDDITNSIYNKNRYKVPIISLSFGNDADKKLLKKLSLKNYGQTSHIYKDTDASKQLVEFYNQISIPLLQRIQFNYNSLTEATINILPLYFKGSEIVVVGKTNGQDLNDVTYVDAAGSYGIEYFTPRIANTKNNLERLWAFMNVKQYLDESLIGNKKDNEKKALDLALKYSFITEITSFVVQNQVVDVNAADYQESKEIDFVNMARFGSYELDESHKSYQSEEDDELPVKTTQQPLSNNNIIPLKIKTNLPWLKNTINSDGTLIFYDGNFKINFNETLTNVTCIEPNYQNLGLCEMLQDCEKLYEKLIDPETFKKYLCTVDSYIGVCCT